MTIAARAGLSALAVVALNGPPALAFDHRCRSEGCRIPFQWNDEPPPVFDDAPYPQGFVLTVPVGTKKGGEHPQPGTLNRYAEVAAALGQCWNPTPSVGDHRWGEITLRVSFRRDGRVNGVPRIPYVSAAADQSTGAGLRSSLLAALSLCTPLRFSPSLGNAIAGQIFAIRFVQQGNS